jgi:hypothetical protein
VSIQKIIRADNQPFAIIPNSAIRNPTITTGAFRLLAYLMSHKDGYELTYEQIERQTTLGRWAINQAAENLTSLGYLEVYRPKGNDGRFGAKHWVIMDPDAEHESTVGNSTMESPHMEKSTDNKENYLLKKTTSKDISTFEQQFDEFWVAYPRKTAKGAAKKAFYKVVTKLGSTALVIDGAVRMSKDPNLPDTQFIPYPATWLNSEGWENESYPSRVRTAQELASWSAETNKRKRDLDVENTQRLLQESQKAAEGATPPPQCEHGKSLVRCIKCSSRLS